ncbi:MAG: ribosomal RNA small subunit methyltransferase A [Candidatus Omnitrophica bacterium]|nr:ribosomal RNA small subunit methyltransferase A [Candidatus Omnitrophota bacterium]
MHTKKELLQLLRRHGLRLHKRLGQHFLIDPDACRRLVDSCQLTADDRVVEIGPGLGALTTLLAETAGEVIAVEIDGGMCRLLESLMVQRPNVRVLCQDILVFPWEELPDSKVIGAIPYHITSPILLMLCERSRWIREAWLSAQQEVAERLIAGPGTKAYGRLSILMQYHFEARRVATISRQAFFPQPEVDSVWVHLRTRATPPVDVRNEALFFELTRAAFGQRRKTLVNCLLGLGRPGFSRARLVEALRQVGLPETIRGERLGLDDFAKLTHLLDSCQQGEGDDGRNDQ